MIDAIATVLFVFCVALPLAIWALAGFFRLLPRESARYYGQTFARHFWKR